MGFLDIFQAVANPAMQFMTNQLNYKIAKETNEMNYKIHQEDNQFNLDMWNRSNAYNDPSQHMQRLLNAGINPMYSDAYGSDVSSPMSSASPIAMQAAQMNPVQFDFSNLKAGEEQQARIDNMNADTENKGADTELKRAQTETENELRDTHKAKLNSEIEVNLSQASLNKANLPKIAEEINVLKKNQQKIDKEIEEIDNNIDISQRHQFVEECATAFSQEMKLWEMDQQERVITIAAFEAEIKKFEADTHRAAQKSHSRLEDSLSTLNEQEAVINEPNVAFTEKHREQIIRNMCEQAKMSYEEYVKLKNEYKDYNDEPENVRKMIHYTNRGGEAAGKIFGRISKKYRSNPLNPRNNRTNPQQRTLTPDPTSFWD